MISDGVIEEARRPSLNWKLEGGVLAVRSDPPAAAGLLWTATNPDARDFRLESLGPAWTPTEIEPDPDGVYRVVVPPPAEGFTGYRVQLGFAPIDGIAGHTYGTPVFVTPDSFPFRLDDPVDAPQSPDWWLCQQSGPLPTAGTRGCPVTRPPLVDVAGLLPFTVFGERIETVNSVARALAPSGKPSGRAWRACTATRLNIASDEVGWYSPIGVGLGLEPYLWRLYAWAETAYAAGYPGLAAGLCGLLNRP